MAFWNFKIVFSRKQRETIGLLSVGSIMNYLCQTEIKREAAATEVLVLPTKEPTYRTDLPKVVRNTEGLKVPAWASSV